jgi:hypothetical protein
MGERPDLAHAVREMTVSSAPDHRSILGRLCNIRTLIYIIEPKYRDGKWADSSTQVPDVAFGDSTLLGELKTLRILRLVPSPHSLVEVARGRLWLENLMKVAPELESLRCYRFIDGHTIRAGHDIFALYSPQRSFPSYAGLPENMITKLHLRRSWFRYRSLEQLLQSFKHLRKFKFSGMDKTMNQLTYLNSSVRPVDAHDGKHLK